MLPGLARLAPPATARGRRPREAREPLWPRVTSTTVAVHRVWSAVRTTGHRRRAARRRLAPPLPPTRSASALPFPAEPGLRTAVRPGPPSTVRRDRAPR